MDDPVFPRPIEPEDHFRFSFLQDAKLSPDGKSIVYAVSHSENVGKEDETDVCTLHFLSLDTGASRQLTSGEAVELGSGLVAGWKTNCLPFYSLRKAADLPDPCRWRRSEASDDPGTGSRQRAGLVAGWETHRI